MSWDIAILGRVRSGREPEPATDITQACQRVTAAVREEEIMRSQAEWYAELAKWRLDAATLNGEQDIPSRPLPW